MKVLMAYSWHRQTLGELRQAFPQVEFVTATPEEMLGAATDVDAIFGYPSREVFLAAKKLRWVHCPSAGVEWIARVPELIESEVVLTNARGAHAATVAEHAFGMLLYLTRRLGVLSEAQRHRTWQRPLAAQPVGLSGLTLGIIGLGNIGSAVAKRGHGFDMKVVAVDANDVPRADYIHGFWLLDGLPELLRRSDVVVVSVPLTPETRRMLGPAQLALMKPSAYLLVISRGGIVDERALVSMLTEGQLAGAGLDVTEQEPLPPESELWGAPNLIITPHCSPASRQTDEMLLAIRKQNLFRFLAGEPLLNIVDKRRGY